MARKRSPETFEKRKRAFEKKRKRADKLAERVIRNAAKKDGEGGDDEDVVELDAEGNVIERVTDEGPDPEPDELA